jgi:hypothetical protein
MIPSRKTKLKASFTYEREYCTALLSLRGLTDPLYSKLYTLMREAI